jgi:hypothetical protein
MHDARAAHGDHHHTSCIVTINIDIHSIGMRSGSASGSTHTHTHTCARAHTHTHTHTHTPRAHVVVDFCTYILVKLPQPVSTLLVVREGRGGGREEGDREIDRGRDRHRHRERDRDRDRHRPVSTPLVVVDVGCMHQRLLYLEHHSLHRRPPAEPHTQRILRITIRAKGNGLAMPHRGRCSHRGRLQLLFWPTPQIRNVTVPVPRFCVQHRVAAHGARSCASLRAGATRSAGRA